MRTHIDWLTFTFTPEYPDDKDGEYSDALIAGLDALFGAGLAQRVFGWNWERRERSRAPYTDAWEMGDAGITLFASPNLTHACIEISGKGCEYLIENATMNKVLTKCHERVTRIDIACDIETNVNPTEFVSQTNHERMRASGYQKSESGETCYVGSQKSDRYARVYRYFAPHPRSHLLRIEHVFRRAYAKIVANAVVDDGIEAVSKSGGIAFGWTHPVWKPSVHQESDISIVAPERKMGKTIYWLIKSCAPAFRRLVEEGTIRNGEEFLRQYFMPNNEDK